MKTARLRLSLASLCALSFCPALSFANGYHFLHQSAEGLGTAYATNGTGAGDISAMFSNPASIIRFDGTRASMGFVLDLPKSKLYIVKATAPYSNGTVPVNGTPAEPSQPIDTAYGASMYMTHEARPGLVFGLAVGAPFAYVSEYPETAASRYTATRTSLAAINVSPTVAYRVNPQWAVGASLNLQYYMADLDTMVPTSLNPSTATDMKSHISAKNFAPGFSIGTEFQATPSTRIGASFRSAIHHSFHGTSELTGTSANYATLVSTAQALGVSITSPNGNADFDIATPYMLQFGLLHQVNDKLELYANANRFGWSVFKNTRIKYSNGLQDTVVDNDWNDSWFTALGLGYQYNSKLKLRAGMAYDWSPTPASAVSPRAPNGDRWNIGLGLSYAPDKDWKLDFGYQYIQFNKVTIALHGGNNIPRGTLDANLDLHANIFMVQINRRF